MCKFSSPADQGLRTAVAALRRYARDARAVIQSRYQRAADLRYDEGLLAAAQLLGTTQMSLSNSANPVREVYVTANGAFSAEAESSQANPHHRISLPDLLR